MNNAHFKVISSIIIGIVFAGMILVEIIGQKEKDERQLILRSKAYQAAFWSMIILLIGYFFLLLAIDTMLHIAAVVLIIMTGLTVFNVICIIFDSSVEGYFGNNKYPRAGLIIIIIVQLMNLDMNIDDNTIHNATMDIISIGIIAMCMALIIAHTIRNISIKKIREE